MNKCKTSLVSPGVLWVWITLITFVAPPWRSIAQEVECQRCIREIQGTSLLPFSIVAGGAYFKVPVPQPDFVNHVALYMGIQYRAFRYRQFGLGFEALGSTTLGDFAEQAAGIGPYIWYGGWRPMVEVRTGGLLFFSPTATQLQMLWNFDLRLSMVHVQPYMIFDLRPFAQRTIGVGIGLNIERTLHQLRSTRSDTEIEEDLKQSYSKIVTEARRKGLEIILKQSAVNGIPETLDRVATLRLLLDSLGSGVSSIEGLMNIMSASHFNELGSNIYVIVRDAGSSADSSQDPALIIAILRGWCYAIGDYLRANE